MGNFSRAFYLISLSAALCASVTTKAQSQNPANIEPQDVETLRVSTTLVTIPVSVKNRDGGFIANLRREDFRIYEDGIEQQVSHFDTADRPFTVLLVLDVSDSARVELKEIQDAAIAFLQELHPDDRAQIIAFDRSLNTLTEVTGDRQALSSAIRRVKTGGGTALYDTLQTVISTHLRRIAGRKAVVILTDGIDTSSVNASFESTIDSAEAQYALIYPIQYNTVGDVLGKQLSAENSGAGAVMYTTPKGETVKVAFDRGNRFLRMLAQTSGGRFQQADSVKNLKQPFARIAEELRRQYGLAYYPTNRDVRRRKRRIKVTVSAPDGVVHARESYTYNPDNR